MSSVICAFKRQQCLHLHFEDDNVFSHLCFQKATMPSFTFQKRTMSWVIYAFKRQKCLHLHFKRRQYLQSFMLLKGDNAFIYISKDDNVFSHLCFQKVTMPSFTFQRRQCLQLFTLSKTTMSSSQRLQCLLSLLVLHRTRRPLFLCFEKKGGRRKRKKRTLDVFCSTELQCPHIFLVSLPWFLSVARSNSKIAQRN